MLSVRSVLREACEAGVLCDAKHEEAVRVEDDEKQNEKRFDDRGTGTRLACFVLYLFVTHHCAIHLIFIFLLIVAKLVVLPFQRANLFAFAYIVLFVK